jgi:uncharacterized protein (TIGR03437 family)
MLFLRSCIHYFFLIVPAVLYGQTATLNLSSGTAAPNGSVSLDLTLGGGTQPAGLQWTLNYATADFTAMSMTVGASGTAASKTLNCFGANGSYTCLLTGVNANTLANGVVAKATLTLSSSTNTSRAVQVVNPMAVAVSGASVASTGTGGVVSPPAPVPDTQPPTAPSGLSASPGSTQITVAWNASTDNVGVTGYQIERCQGTGCSNFALAGTSPGTSYVSTGLTAGTVYSTRVRAIDQAGNLSAYSAVVSATTTTTTTLLLSSLSCTPDTLSTSAMANCTITLSGAAPAAGAWVSLADNNANLSVPGSFKIFAGATTGDFTVTAGTISSDQTALVTASLGSSSKTDTVYLKAPVSVLSIWSPSTVPAVITDSDTAAVELGVKFRSTVSGYVVGVRFYKGPQNTGTHTGSLWSNFGSLLARVTFANETASGWQQALFSNPVAINADTTYVVSYQAPKGLYSSNTDYFSSTGVSNNTLRALKDGESGGNGVYRYGQTAFPNATWRSSNYWVDVVFSQQSNPVLSAAPTNADPLLALSSESFRASAGEEIMAASKVVKTGSSLSCNPRVVLAGDPFTCDLRLEDGTTAEAGAVATRASGSDARLPARLIARAGQRSLTFHGAIDKAASHSLLLISAGGTEDQIEILPAGAPVISAPQILYARPGESIAFTISARDGAGQPVTISTLDLPPGAFFEGTSNRFSWTPQPNEEGDYTVSYSALNAAGFSSTSQTRIFVGSGKPLVTSPSPFTCAAGSIATLNGRWLSLTDENLADRTGSSTELGGTTVRVNGGLTPILFASPNRVDFLCPSDINGQHISVVLETELGATLPLQVAIADAKPLLLPINGSENEGAITIGDTDRFSVIRDVRGIGEPAHVDDLIVIRATGVGKMVAENSSSLVVRIGDVEAKIESISPDPDSAGIYRIQVKIPEAVGKGEVIPVRLIVQSSTGESLPSNTVTMAIE